VSTETTPSEGALGTGIVSNLRGKVGTFAGERCETVAVALPRGGTGPSQKVEQRPCERVPPFFRPHWVDCRVESCSPLSLLVVLSRVKAFHRSPVSPVSTETTSVITLEPLG